MKTTNLVSGIFLAMIINLSILYQGCKKDEPNPASPAVFNSASSSSSMRTVSNNSSAQASFDDATNVAEEGSLGEVQLSGRLSGVDLFQTSCAHLTVDHTSIPHLLTIDFGASDCLGRDGNYRRGQILVSWIGSFHGPGSSHTIAFNNYYLNFNKIDGTIVVSDSGRNAAHHLVFGITINGTVTVSPLYDTTGTAGTITFAASLTKELIHGEQTVSYDRDDVFLISGTASGSTVNGVTFTSSIDPTTPLKKEVGFMNFTSGIVNVSSNGQAILIDYGYLNSQRDNLASVTVNGQTYIVVLDNDGQVVDHHI